ncbi:polysaccharide deacetylase family protein [Effusibacillus consociatus]|uniref:Polysaccharide deacetylase family protein n=1 Tax=Effusibacillus consociatus TaxID=1117041 RepID=A0ABV9Q4Q9_9BACL
MRILMAGVCLLMLAATDAAAQNGNPEWEKRTVSIQQNLTKEDLQRKASKLFKQPIDAVVSRAGKPNVIPELNGIELDVEATWQNFQKNGSQSPDFYVYKQLPPKIKLSDYPNLPIYQGNPHKKEMSLMINVAWGTEYIDGILQVLKDNSAKATFFLDGSWLAKNPEVAKRIVSEGHEIGNHAYTHPDMAALSPERQLHQIVKTQEEIKQVLGVESKWFAPPSGSFNQATVKIARSQGMGTVLWTLDTVDWRRPPKEQILNRIIPHARNGAMILMHPTEPTLGALRTLVPDLKKKGFQLVTVSELLSPIRKVE